MWFSFSDMDVFISQNYFDRLQITYPTPKSEINELFYSCIQMLIDAECSGRFSH